MTFTGAEVLAVRIHDYNDAGANTIKEYLKTLLTQLFVDGEGFSGKRPFGSGNWEHELYKPLIVAGLVKGKLDDDGFIVTVNEKAANKLIFAAIEAL